MIPALWRQSLRVAWFTERVPKQLGAKEKTCFEKRERERERENATRLEPVHLPASAYYFAQGPVLKAQHHTN